MSLNFILSPTSPSWNTPASTGWTPKPTPGPFYQPHGGILRRNAVVGLNTCGWVNGDKNQPATCSVSSTCVADPQDTAFACCDAVGNCDFATACNDGAPPLCIENQPGECSHIDWTIGCNGGGWSCFTNVILGGVPFSSVECGETPGSTANIQTTYAGGPVNQQVPFPYSQYVIVASSAAAVSSSSAFAAASASASRSDNSDDDTESSEWVSQHKTILIGAIVGGAVLILLCCCIFTFRRKRRASAMRISAPPITPSQRYQNTPQQYPRGQEDYPMMQYQYGPNK